MTYSITNSLSTTPFGTGASKCPHEKQKFVSSKSFFIIRFDVLYFSTPRVYTNKSEIIKKSFKISHY